MPASIENNRVTATAKKDKHRDIEKAGDELEG